MPNGTILEGCNRLWLNAMVFHFVSMPGLFLLSYFQRFIISIHIETVKIVKTHLWLLSIASPPDMASSPVNILKVVVLPAPFTPSRPKHCMEDNIMTLY